MQHFNLVFGTIAVYWVVMVSPGPNFVLITHTSMIVSRSHGLAAAWGVVIGSAIWMIAALVGVSALLKTFPFAASLIQTAGGLYLIYLGIKSWRNANCTPTAKNEIPIGGRFGATLVQGILTNLANPKTVVFYSSIFAAFAAPSAPAWAKASIIGGIMVSAFVWYSSMALFFSTARARQIYVRAKVPIDRICGVIMAGLGVRLLTSRV